MMSFTLHDVVSIKEESEVSPLGTKIVSFTVTLKNGEQADFGFFFDNGFKEKAMAAVDNFINALKSGQEGCKKISDEERAK